MKGPHNFVVEKILKEFSGKSEEINKYIRIYLIIKQFITSLEFPNEWLLPTTRQLADELKVSRTTVLKAYELLLLENLINTKPGSGIKVNYTVEQEVNTTKSTTNENFKYPVLSELGQSYLKNISLINRQTKENLAFRPGLPPIDIFPINQWKKLLDYYWRHVKASGMSYSQASGLDEFKVSICKYLKVCRNINCKPDQIVIVSGSLQSLFLVSNTILDKGDTVILENPVFPNVHSIFKSSQAQVIAAPLDHEGINLKAIEEIATSNPKLVHVTPSDHYPLGTKMTLNRRLEVLKWVAEKGALIIENDYENEIANLNEFMPTLFSLDQEDRTIYMGTFNRLLHPSIRLGYMILPAYLIPVVEAFQEHSHRFVAQSTQTVMNLFIEKNYLFKHIKNCLAVTYERHEFFKSEFALKIKSMHIQEKPFSSFHLIAFFNEPKTIQEEAEIILKLKTIDVTVLSLGKCFVGTPEKTGLIFGYSSVRLNIIKQTIHKISQIIP